MYKYQRKSIPISWRMEDVPGKSQNNQMCIENLPFLHCAQLSVILSTVALPPALTPSPAKAQNHSIHPDDYIASRPKAAKVNCLSCSSHPVLYVPSHPGKESCAISALLQGDCCFTPVTATLIQTKKRGRAFPLTPKETVWKSIYFKENVQSYFHNLKIERLSYMSGVMESLKPWANKPHH